jgi:hypothetical protein
MPIPSCIGRGSWLPPSPSGGDEPGGAGSWSAVAGFPFFRRWSRPGEEAAEFEARPVLLHGFGPDNSGGAR